MNIPARLLIAAFLMVASPGHSMTEPVWPVRAGTFDGRLPIESYLQHTASGKPESALFGCIRTNGQRFHEAIDIAPVLARKRGEATDAIVAIHDGIVRHMCKVSGNSSYGRYVVLEHTVMDIALYSLYAHLATIEDTLTVGQVVKAGDVLGVMGRSAGGYTIPRERSHLHLEVGLRLSEDFRQWYRRQGYDTPNKHGNFNGINLIGFDPLAYFEAFQTGKAKSPLDFIEQIPPAVMVHVYTDRRPDFIERYPELVLPGCDPRHQSGWEVLLSAWGLPLSMKPISKDELIGVQNPGDLSVVGINRIELGNYSCRRIISESNGRVILGRGGQAILEILFMPDRRSD